MRHHRPRNTRLDLRAAAILLAATLGACAAGPVSGPAVAGDPSPVSEIDSAVGAYLAGQHAIRSQDIRRASQYFDRVLESDPGSQGLRRRAFLLRLEAGRLDDAARLAGGLADTPGEGASVARLYQAVEAARRGDYAATIAEVERLDDGRVNKALVPIIAAWSEIGLGAPDAAERRLAVLAGDDGFAGLYTLHAAMLAEAAGRIGLAAERYETALARNDPAPLRLRLAAAGFDARNGRLDAALRRIGPSEDGVGDPAGLRAMLRRVAASAGTTGAPDANRGIAEVLFDLASALQRDRGADSAMVFARLALRLQPDFDLAALLVAEILDDRKRLRGGARGVRQRCAGVGLPTACPAAGRQQPGRAWTATTRRRRGWRRWPPPGRISRIR